MVDTVSAMMTLNQIPPTGIGDVPKAFLTAFLALATLLLWELWLKPARAKLNLALVLIAEIELNLEEIAYFRLCRQEDPENQLVNLMLPRASFTSLQSTIGELSPTDLRDVIRFYAVTSKIEATTTALAVLEDKHNAATLEADRALFAAALESGLSSLGRLLDDAWVIGASARRSLDLTVRRYSPSDPPPLEDEGAVITRVTAKRRAHTSA